MFSKVPFLLTEKTRFSYFQLNLVETLWNSFPLLFPTLFSSLTLHVFHSLLDSSVMASKKQFPVTVLVRLYVHAPTEGQSEVVFFFKKSSVF